MGINVYQMVTDRIIKDLESGNIPWEKPWINTSGTDVARSHGDGRCYSLLNQMLVGIPGEYVTWNQAKKEGGHIKKGAKSSWVVFFKTNYVEITDKDGKTVLTDAGDPMTKPVPILRYSNVFHIEDTEGITPKYVISKGPVSDNLPITEIDAAVSRYLTESGVKLRHYEQGQSYYSPGADEVILPHMNQFQNAESYYATLFHELGHSTGHKDRLAREMGKTFGDAKYSREELVAEITSAVLCNHFGIDTSKVQRNTAGYIQHWLKVLKEDNRMVVVASGRAEKAVNMILGITPETTEEPAA